MKCRPAGKPHVSGKLIPTTPDIYRKMGEKHTDKDTEVQIETLEKTSKLVNAHTSMWIKMMNLGKTNKQAGRFRESYLGNEMPPLMYLLVKDHKEKDEDGLLKTRPVVSGCIAYNAGLSEMVSEILEVVFRAKKYRIGVLSSEDFLSNMH